MSRKNFTPYILIIILFVLGGFIYTFKILPQQYEARQLNKTILNFKPSDIDRVEVAWRDTNTVIEKSNDNWYVLGQPADERLATNIEKLASLKKDKLVSEQPEKHSQFEVTVDKGVLVKLFKGDRLKAQLIIGKMGPIFSSSYVRINNEDKVYLTATNLGLYWQKDNWVKVQDNSSDVQ